MANQALCRFQVGVGVSVVVRRRVDLPGQRKEQDQPYGGSTDAVSEPSKHHWQFRGSHPLSASGPL